MMEALTADRIGGTMAGESKDGRVILALDEGTTSARAIVFAADGGVLSLAQREIGLDFPQPGWVQQDPLEIWTAQRETAAEALRRSGVAISRRGRHRHHQPARDHHRVGQGHVAADRAGDRVAGPAHR